MIKTIMATAATIGILAGAAHAQGYGDQTQQRVVQDDGAPAAQLPRERVGVAMQADPTPTDDRMYVRTAPVVSAAPYFGMRVIQQDPGVPSAVGLTPGAPLGSDGNDQKAVAGFDSTTGYMVR